MCNQIKTSGRQMFMGVEIPIVEGGFGDGCKCITDKTVSEIHEVPAREIRRLIKDNISRFRNGIDYIDLKGVGVAHTLDLTTLGYAKQSITQAKSIYLLSERGYSKVIKIMDTDKAWEVHDHLMDEYFSMREVIQNTLSIEDLAMLKVMKSNTDEEKMLAIQEYRKTVVQPLKDTIEKQKPMVGLAEMRIDKKGCYSITDVTKSLHLKKGQITRWAKEQGFIHKTLPEVNNKGEGLFKVYSTDGKYNSVGITNNGLQYINNHLDEIKTA